MDSSYRSVLVAVPPPTYEWYRESVDGIRKTAAMLSRIPETRLIFLGIYSAVSGLEGAEVNLVPPEIFQEAVREHEAKLRLDIEEYVRWFSEKGITYSIIMERGSDPAEIIVNTARAVNADLVLLGAHHRESVLDLFAPDVAKKVSKLAPCDVLTIHGQKK